MDNDALRGQVKSDRVLDHALQCKTLQYPNQLGDFFFFGGGVKFSDRRVEVQPPQPFPYIRHCGCFYRGMRFEPTTEGFISSVR